MKRAPRDLIQNKTAVFWLQYPFCSTSACQLAPLGTGRESRDLFGGKYQETGDWNLARAGRYKSEYPGFRRMLEQAKCCLRAEPNPLSSSGLLSPSFPLQSRNLPQENSYSRRNPSDLVASPWAVWQHRGNELSEGNAVPAQTPSQNKKSLFFYLGKGKKK